MMKLTVGNLWRDALEGQLMSAEDVRGRLVESVLAGVGGQYGE